MNEPEFTNLWCEVRSELFDGFGGYDRSRALAKLLGLSYPEPGHVKELWLDGAERERLIPILKGLQGPHGKTLMKVYQIQRRDK